MPESTKPKPITGEDLMKANPDLAQFLSGIPKTTALNQTVSVATAAATPNAPPPPDEAQSTEPDFPLPPAKDPKERYLEDLKKLDITLAQASEIIDSMILKGYWEEQIPITKKLSVKFRTRGQEAADRLNRALNDQNPQFTGPFYSLVAKYNLAASLVSYGPYQFDPSTDKGFDAVMDYITKKIPLPIYQSVVNKLAKFDEKLSTIMTEEAVGSFF